VALHSRSHRKNVRHSMRLFQVHLVRELVGYIARSHMSLEICRCEICGWRAPNHGGATRKCCPRRLAQVTAWPENLTIKRPHRTDEFSDEWFAMHAGCSEGAAILSFCVVLFITAIPTAFVYARRA